MLLPSLPPPLPLPTPSGASGADSPSSPPSPYQEIATACLHLAAKVQEAPKPIREVALQCQKVLRQREPEMMELLNCGAVREGLGAASVPEGAEAESQLWRGEGTLGLCNWR